MNTLRIFISSPSDVQDERTVAGRVIERLQGKYWSFVRLDDVFWETKVARATAHFQDELLNPGQCDFVIGILWSRLGSPLPEKFRKLTGEAHAAGTEWELAQAFTAYDQSVAETGDPLTAKPDVVVYRRTEERAYDPADDEGRQQRESLNAFLEREFFNQDEHHTIKRALTFYGSLDEFETRLQGDLEQLILRRIPALKPGFEPPPISGPPFKDLAHFDFEDCDRFFGRNRAIRELQQRLYERAAEGMPFVLIYGGSGYGKSSLMRAGLAPVVTRPGGALPGMDRWRRVLFQPGQGSGPLCERLARGLLAPSLAHDLEQQKIHEHWPLPGLPELAETSIEPDDTGEFWDAASLTRLLADEEKLIYAAAGVARTLDRIGHSLLLQIDQLEEVFTSETVSAAEREAFFRALAALTRTGRVWTVATMRSEYFPRIAETPALAGLVRNNGGYILAPPNDQELREIIRFPALAARLDYERALSPREIGGGLSTTEHLDEQILADAKGSPDALPLLEFTLHKLYSALLDPDGNRTSELLRWDTYAAFGGLKGAIALSAEDTFETLAPHVQGAADALFGNLVRVDARGTDAVTRKRPPVDELRATAAGAGELIDAFLGARLLVTDEETGRAVVTLAHEALITHWPRLAEWVSRHRAILRSRQRLEENARQWSDSSRSKKLLLAEGRLAEAEEVENSRLFRLSQDEHALTSESRHLARRRVQFARRLAAVFIVLALAAGVAAVVAWKQRHEAIVAKAEADQQRNGAVQAQVEERKQRDAALASQAEERKQRELVQQRDAEQRRLLHEASMADFSMALQRIEQEGRWSQGVAHFAHALDWESTNQLVAARLYSTIAWSALEKTPVLRHSLAHEHFVWSAQFSRDETRLVTASGDDERHIGVANVWDVATGRTIGQPMPHTQVVNTASFSPDGTQIVTASGEDQQGEARLWDATTGQPLADALLHESRVEAASFSPDGTRIVTGCGGSESGEARIWDTVTGESIGKAMMHKRAVQGATFSPDGKWIVTASEDYTAQVWDGRSGKPVGKAMRNQGDHEGQMNTAAFSPDGTRIVTASGDGENGADRPHYGEVRLWNASTGNPIGEPLLHGAEGEQGMVNSASFSADGMRIVTASADKTVHLFESATGKRLGDIIRHQAGVNSAAFSPDGTCLVTASDDGTARIWDATAGQPLSEPMRCMEGGKNASFAPAGTRVATISGNKTVQIWEAANLRMLGEPIQHKGASWFSPDGTKVLTDSPDGVARLWDAATSRALGPEMPHHERLVGACFDGGAVRIAVSGSRSVRVWDAVSGTALGEAMQHTDQFGGATFSADGTRLLVFTRGSDGEVRIWDVLSGKQVGETMRPRGPNHASFSPDGTRIVTSSFDLLAQVWDAATGQPIGKPMEHGASVESASFSPDGTRIVTVSGERGSEEIQAARVWDATTGTLVGEPMPHPEGKGMLMMASFSPEGRRVVTASYDQTAVVWDAATGQPLTEPMKHAHGVDSASFSPDGKWIVTSSGNFEGDGGGSDGEIRVWNATTGKEMAEPIYPEFMIESASFSLDGTQLLIVPSRHERVGIAHKWEVGSLLHLPAETPKWVREWARAVAGWTFDANGVMQAMSPEDRIKILYSPHVGDDPWSALVRWLVADPALRTIQPDSKRTCREVALLQRDLGSEACLKLALRYDPTVPLARLLLAGALLRQDAANKPAERDPSLPQRAAFLRDYDLQRIPDDAVLWERAVRALHEQKDDARAHRALLKLEKLAPEKAAALRKQLAV